MNIETQNEVRPRKTAKKSIINIENLTLRYGNHLILNDITFPIKDRSITTLIGPSGAGKTSFLLCLNRLIDMVSKKTISGLIEYETYNVLDPKIDVIYLRKKIGMIFQKPNPFPVSIWKNLEIPLREHGVKDKKKISQIIEENLKNVGLWDEVKDRLHRSAFALSGGQQQRLCIARALVLKPQILLMDEPCSALDPVSSGVIEDLIQKLRGQYTIFVVTHNLAQAKRIGDYTALFWVKNNCGCLVEYGDTDQVFNKPRHEITSAYINGKRG